MGPDEFEDDEDPFFDEEEMLDEGEDLIHPILMRQRELYACESHYHGERGLDF